MIDYFTWQAVAAIAGLWTIMFVAVCFSISEYRTLKTMETKVDEILKFIKRYEYTEDK